MKQNYTDLRINGNRISWMWNGRECLIVPDCHYEEWEVREWLDGLSDEDMKEHVQTAFKLRTFGELELMFNETYS